MSDAQLQEFKQRVFLDGDESEFIELTVRPTSTAEQLRFRAVAWLVSGEASARATHDIFVHGGSLPADVTLRESTLSPFDTVRQLHEEHGTPQRQSVVLLSRLSRASRASLWRLALAARN